MIIVEGPDGAGKTTLISELSSSFSLPIAPRVVSSGAEAMTDLKRWVQDNVAAGWQETLFDRHRLISEPIYGTLLRPEKLEPGFDELSWLTSYQAQFEEIRPVVILCLPHLSTCLENYKQDEDNARLFDDRTYRQLYWMYHHWASTHPAAYVWDYEYDNLPQLKSYIRIVMKGRKHG